MSNDKAEQFKATIEMLTNAARTIGMLDLPAYLGELEHYDTMGPLMDPTAWMRDSQAIVEHKQLLQAAMPLWQHVQDVNRRHMKKKGGPYDHLGEKYKKGGP